MKVGGYSHSKGITFYNKIYKINSYYKDGKKVNDIQWISPPKLFSKIEKVPVLGGLVVLYYQWKIFSFKIKLVYLTLILMILIDEIFYFSYRFSNYFNFIYPILALAILINFKTILRIFRLHGAEHKVINCYTEHGIVNFDLVKSSSRFNKRCGSNLVLLFLLLYMIMWVLKIESFIGIIFLLLLSIQIMKIISKKNTSFDRYINLLQYITVQEPTNSEIQLATEAFKKLLTVTYIYQNECLAREKKKQENLGTI